MATKKPRPPRLQPTPQPKAPPKQSFSKRLSTSLRNLLLLILLLVVLFIALYMFKPATRPYLDKKFRLDKFGLDNRFGHSIQYAKLVRQPLPTPNSLPSPIPGAHLTDTWGAARSGGRKHEGIDIFAERGTPIQSTTEGIVRKVGVDRLGGNIVSVIGPGGASHYYAHLQKFADISEGDWIEKGDIIGYVGDSGNAKGTPTHVHYGVYIATGAVNPYPLLAKDKTDK